MSVKKRMKTSNTFTKEQILNAKKYIHLKDLVNVLLFDSKTYTFVEVDKLIQDFKKGKVK
ncbi:hypothetical protein [Candidatus Galacturonibacter soehngenii]|uniref:Phage protein n=1 Tax=Candidatus Galacturonatibacter soehngenii TaxID=2307010 RepID=A0A7V7QJE1_9FIRM|nr:hypothetical protein [Candidatus Galacturonibacter soehngenii]KAB1436592.1 hypothetical protein F7O84_14630 [Candidatus Galacturonibacter soehngenii]